MGCPDAVCDEIKRIPGIARVEFDQETRLFRVKFHQRFVNQDDIFAAVWQAGKKGGRDFLAQIIT
jgi:copper chaperone CopZ